MYHTLSDRGLQGQKIFDSFLLFDFFCVCVLEWSSSVWPRGMLPRRNTEICCKHNRWGV